MNEVMELFGEFFSGIGLMLQGLFIFIKGFVPALVLFIKGFAESLGAFIKIFIKVFPVLAILALTVFASKAWRHLFKYLEEKSQRKESLWKAALVTALQKPAGLIIWIVGISFVLQFIHFKTNEEISAAVLIIEVIAIVAALVWFFIQLSKNLDKDAILMAISSKFSKKDKDD